MARKKMYYMVLDTETATLPLAEQIANGNADIKKRIAIARPLIYDFGYTITDRKGCIIKKVSHLIAETFSVPSVFNTAYYANKRPIYLAAIQKGEIDVQPWNVVMNEFVADLETVDSIGCFNSMFDLKKALPFTELYIQKLYSPDFYAWEQQQFNLCKKIANTPYKKNPNKVFKPDVLEFRGESYPCFDLWGLACEHLLNTDKYRNACLDNNMITNSGEFFSSSAECTYRYLKNKYNFDEAHTALEDAMIETFILSKVAQKHAIDIGIAAFPFRILGKTYTHVMKAKHPNTDRIKTIVEKMDIYLNGVGVANYKAYHNRIQNIVNNLKTCLP